MDHLSVDRYTCVIWPSSEGEFAIRPRTSSVDGVAGDHLVVAPPFVVTDREIDEMVNVLRKAVLDVWREVRSSSSTTLATRR